MTSQASTVQLRPSRRRSPFVAASFSLLGVVSLFVLVGLLQSLGTSACDVYCGAPGGLFGSLILIPITIALWITGAIATVFALIVSRARSWLAWLAVLLSLVVPAAAVMVVANAGGLANSVL